MPSIVPFHIVPWLDSILLLLLHWMKSVLWNSQPSLCASSNSFIWPHPSSDSDLCSCRNINYIWRYVFLLEDADVCSECSVCIFSLRPLLTHIYGSILHCHIIFAYLINNRIVFGHLPRLIRSNTSKAIREIQYRCCFGVSQAYQWWEWIWAAWKYKQTVAAVGVLSTFTRNWYFVVDLINNIRSFYISDGPKPSSSSLHPSSISPNSR